MSTDFYTSKSNLMSNYEVVIMNGGTFSSAILDAGSLDLNECYINKS